MERYASPAGLWIWWRGPGTENAYKGKIGKGKQGNKKDGKGKGREGRVTGRDTTLVPFSPLPPVRSKHPNQYPIPPQLNYKGDVSFVNIQDTKKLRKQSRRPRQNDSNLVFSSLLPQEWRRHIYVRLITLPRVAAASINADDSGWPGHNHAGQLLPASTQCPADIVRRYVFMDENDKPNYNENENDRFYWTETDLKRKFTCDRLNENYYCSNRPI